MAKKKEIPNEAAADENALETELDSEESAESDDIPTTKSKVKAAGKPTNIMDPEHAPEPPKRAKREEFTNKLDLTPVLEKLDDLASKMVPITPEPVKAKQKKVDDKGFADILGDW